MTTDAQAPAPADVLLAYLSARGRTAVTEDQDLFAAGLVTSLFAMELIVHIEQTFGVEIGGSDLQLENFRTVASMSGLITRLRGAGDG
ncbi:acyl carrier protein [Lentzea sp. NPDC054927]